jgi:isopenicillin N synthase-like dioxygenase
MTDLKVKNINPDSIPVVDISSLINGRNPEKVAIELHKASTELGFIYVKGHGIPEVLIQNLRLSAFEFFRAERDVKENVRITDQHRGWISSGSAKMTDDALPDLKESFLWGQQNTDENYFKDGHSLRGKNRWPNFLPSLRSSAIEYFDHADRVARYLMKGFALGLGLSEGFFLKTCDRPLSRASLVYYPDQSKELGEKQFGVSSHTDFGVLTVLCQDSVGGLEVQDINGEWFKAPPIAETLIVNVADLLSRWTDGVYKSTPHRVVNNSGKERLSVVMAFDPNPETLIDAKNVFGKDYSPKETPITCGDYLDWRFQKAFAHRK